MKKLLLPLSLFLGKAIIKSLKIKRTLLLIILCMSFLSAIHGQQCSENTNVNGIAGTGFSNGTIGQSFTACENGLLASVSVQSGNSGTGFNNVIVQIFSGDGFGGTLLATTGQVHVKANRTTTWGLTGHNIQVVEGQKYTARFLTQSGTPMMAYGTGTNTAIDYYTRGRIHGAAQSHNDMFFSAVIQTLPDPVKAPEDDAVDVTRDTEVVLSFARDMEAVSGNITIENITDASTQTVDVTTLTIDGGDVLMPLSTPLLPGKDYDIVIPSGVLRATNGIPFTGLASGDWTFTTSTKPYAILSTTSADLTNDAVFPFAIDFSDVVTGFALADFTITNGTASNLAGSGDSFTFDVTPAADGEVEVSLPPDMVEAGASNGNDSTGYALEYDGTAPDVELRTAVAGTIQTSIFDIEVVFDEPVEGFETSDLQIVNAEVLSTTNTNDSLFTVSLRALTEGQITVDLAASIADDLAGNVNTAAPAIIDVTFSVDLESNIVSYYPFDGNANDTVSTGFNGTVSGAVLATGFDGTSNGAYTFDGTDQITFGDTPIGSGSFSIGLWVKIPEGLGSQNRLIIEKRPVCSEGRFFSIIYRNHATRGHEIVVSQRNNGSATAPIVSNLTAGEWMYVTYVKDNGNSSSSIYINGVQESEVAWTASYNFENSANLIAGSGPCVGADGTLRFIGDMDDIHVYDRALTAVEIDLLIPFVIEDLSADSGEDIQAGQAIDVTLNKNVVQSSVNATNITATGSVSGAITIDITSSQDNISITAPAGWPIDEDVTISLSGLLAENGTTLPNTDLTYSVIADEAVGLILHYPISGNVDEAIGNIAGQDGTTSGTLFVEGADGDPFGALSFDGSDDLVTLGDAPISTESFSISLLVKVPVDGSESANTIILSKRQACTEGRLFDMSYLRSGDKVRFSASARSNAAAGGVATGFDFPVDKWLNLTFVKDNDTKKYKLIVNGVLEAEANWALTTVNVENTAPIRLGNTPCNGADGTQRYDGLMDDVRVYDRVIEPRVLSIEPVRGTINAVVDTVVTISFDRAVDVSSLEASTITFSDDDAVDYTFTTAFSSGDSVLTITPDSNLPKGTKFTVTVDTLSALIGSDFAPFETSFTTVFTQLLSHSPTNGTSNVDSLETISFKFDNAIEMSTLEQGIKVLGSLQGPVAGTFSMPTTDSVVFTPSAPYFPNEMVTVYLMPDLQDTGGKPIGNPKTFKFHVKSGDFSGATLSYEISQLSASTTSPRILVPGDMDNDGDLDLIGGEDTPGTLLYFENLGSGNYSAGQTIDSNNGYFDVKVTDFDFDGDADIVTVDRSVSQGIYWYENDGSASFTEHLIKALPNSDSRSIVVADFNKDGSMDVATASYGSNRFHVFESNGDQLFAAANAGQPLYLDDFDLNNDGDLDLAAANYSSGTIAAWSNSGIGTFSGSVANSAATHARSVSTIDFDNDGDVDIVYAAQSANQIGVLLNNGAGSFTNVQVGSVTAPHRIDVGDADGDGDFDIVYTTAGGDVNFHYLENSGSLTLWVSKKLISTETFAGTFTQTAEFADIDKDGDLDVLATDAGAGFYIFENKIVDLNEPPTIANSISDQTLAEDDANGLTLDVSNVFIDNDGDTFTLSADSDNAAVTAAINGDNLELNIATADFSGDVNITVTADDGNGTNADTFVLSVTPVNDAPAFDLSTSTVTVVEDFTTTETITVTQNQPGDEDAPTYSISPVSSTLANVSIDETTGEVTITGIADAFGSEDFTVTADDGATENSSATQTFTLTVTGENDAPVLENPIADISIDEDPSANQSVSLTNAFNDVDGENLTFGLNVTAGSDLASVTLDNGTVNIAPVADAFGTVSIAVSAEDAAGETVSDDFDVVINPVNDAPTFMTSGDVSTTKNFTDTENVTVTADAIPFGEDAQVVTYTLSPASVSFANVSIDQSSGEVSITAVADAFGSQEFTITANDGEATNNTATQTFTLDVVDKTPQNVTFTGVANKTFGDPDFEISAAVESSLPVNFTVVSGPLTITESAVGNTGGGSVTLSIDGAGQAVIEASNDGDATFAQVLETITIEVAKADQVITVQEITNKSSEAAPFSVIASVDTELALSYSVTGPATIAENVVTLDGTLGTVEVTVSQAGTDNYNEASETVSFEVVEKLGQTITFNELADVTYGATDQTLTATSDSGLPVSFAIVSGTATLTGNVLSFTRAGTIVVEATQAGDVDYVAASPVQQTIVVSKAPLDITADDQTITFGDALPTLTYSYNGFVNGESEADLTATISISTTAGGEEGQANAGTYPITISVIASEAGDNYDFNVTNATLTIEKADQVITLSSIEDKTPTDAPFEVVASVDSDLALTYEVSGPATITGTTITLDGAEGTVVVTVSQEGDVNHNASSESTSFEVAVPLAVGDEIAGLKIYPNPVANYLMVESNKKMNLRFYTLGGKLVKALNEVNGKVDLHELESGTYMMEVVSEGRKEIKRIVKAN